MSRSIDGKRNFMDTNHSTEEHRGKFANRTQARTVAFQILYQDDMNPGSLEQFAESYLEQELPKHEPLLRFARSLIQGVNNNREEIDRILSEVAEHWALSRMNVTDRSILRLAACEILYLDTPKPVVINEAVELAKKFGTADSAAFVNGILDKVQAT